MQGYLTALLGLDEFILKSSVVGSFFRLKDEYDHKLRVRGQNPSMHPLTQTGERTLHGTSMGHSVPLWDTMYPYETQCTHMGHSVPLWDTECTPMGHRMYPYGTQNVPLWDTECTLMGHRLYPYGTQCTPMRQCTPICLFIRCNPIG